MNALPWQKVALAIVATLLLIVPVAPAHAEDPPVDETPAIEILEGEEEETTEREAEAEQDDPTARLGWQRAAWGVVTPSFRSLALSEGKKHSARKNAPGPKWVSIGPIGADFEQNGSFTGHVRDSGRARAILPHPTEPEIVYFLTSGGGLWRTNNWSSPNTECAARV